MNELENDKLCKENERLQKALMNILLVGGDGCNFAGYRHGVENIAWSALKQPDDTRSYGEVVAEAHAALLG